MPVAQPIAFATVELEAVRFNEHGLVAAIVQDEANGQVLMMAWMNVETLAQSMNEGRTVFWSRSRSEVWRKGDTSGDRQFIRSAHYDCDGDTLLFVVEQEGKGACHTGERSCFYRAFGSAAEIGASAEVVDAAGVAPVWLPNGAAQAAKL
jgi:phosphoribosyl-AMP cyclohydrolase/phosphoribosyl-ATP pyrophosphohydrolase/phosphoribosyl-AMP cyclohydrolase